MKFNVFALYLHQHLGLLLDDREVNISINGEEYEVETIYLKGIDPYSGNIVFEIEQKQKQKVRVG